MDKNITPADRARNLLAAAGYKRTQVSVRADGQSVFVTIRDARVKMFQVREIVGCVENVHRDQFGDVLSGGNTFLTIKYTREVLAPFVEQGLAALASVDEGQTVRIGFHVAFQSSTGWNAEVRTFTKKGNGREVLAHGLHFGVEQIVIDNLSRGAYAL